MTVLPSLDERAATALQDDDAEVRFSTPKNTSGYFALRIVISRAILSKIDDPARVTVVGNPHEGFIIQATRSKEAGTHAINYKVGSGRTVTFTVPFKPTKLSKVERKMVAVRARVRDGKIHTSGMPAEWIAARSPWINGEPEPTNHHRLAAKPATGTIQVNGAAAAPAANGNGSPTAPMPKLPKIDPAMTNDQLRIRLSVTLQMAESLKAELEKRTGLKLRVSRDLRNVVVDME